MQYRKNRIIFLISVVIAGIFLFTACSFSVLEKEGKEVSFETPKVFRGTSLGAELPFIAYESEHQLIFYNYLGIFIYDLDSAEMLQALKPSDAQFNLDTQGDQATEIKYNTNEKTISVFKVRTKTFKYFYVYDINKGKLYQYPIDQMKKGQDNPKVTGRMETDDWTAWNLLYTSELTGKTYYPFRSIAK